MQQSRRGYAATLVQNDLKLAQYLDTGREFFLTDGALREGQDVDDDALRRAAGPRKRR